VELVKAIEDQITRHRKGKVYVDGAFSEASGRHSRAQARVRSLRDHPLERSRLTDEELEQHELTIAAAGRELAAAADECGKEQGKVSAWMNADSGLQQELAQAKAAVDAITLERSRLTGTASQDEERAANMGLGRTVQV
jgi:hypothetical protein